MKQFIAITAILFTLIGFNQKLDAQVCQLEVNSKFVMSLTCRTLDRTVFDLNTTVLPFKTEKAVVNFCPMASSNLITFTPIDGTKNIHVELLQNNTPGKSWTSADWNQYFIQNSDRFFRAVENVNK